MHELDITWRLGLALLLSTSIGLERETRQKSAGLSTYSLVGVGSALFMLVSIFGFGDLSNQRHVGLDPSRVAAQIVSGIGFIGGGIIFVRRDTVRGLTTAAGVWVTAAVGMACGGNLPILAVATTIIYFLVAYGYPRLVDVLPRSRESPAELSIVYRDGHGILREALAECARRGFAISDLSIKHDRHRNGNGNGNRGDHVTVDLELRGRGSLTELAAELDDMRGIVDVSVGEYERAAMP
jgi:putative Mg2+ transporter-C (MgtC) family protein